MTTSLESVLGEIARLHTYCRGERRTLHKPLLPVAITELAMGKTRHLGRAESICSRT